MGQTAHALTGRVVDGVGNGRGRADDADSSGTIGEVDVDNFATS
jgi:hypothetical protein